MTRSANVYIKITLLRLFIRLRLNWIPLCSTINFCFFFWSWFRHRPSVVRTCLVRDRVIASTRIRSFHRPRAIFQRERFKMTNLIPIFKSVRLIRKRTDVVGSKTAKALPQVRRWRGKSTIGATMVIVPTILQIKVRAASMGITQFEEKITLLWRGFAVAPES